MPQYLGLVSIVVRDYDEAIAFYVGKLGFSLIEDTYQPAQDKRWVVVSPRRVRKNAACSWPGQRTSIRSPASATRREAEFSCSSTPMTSGATSMPTVLQA